MATVTTDHAAVLSFQKAVKMKRYYALVDCSHCYCTNTDICFGTQCMIILYISESAREWYVTIFHFIQQCSYCFTCC